MRCLWLGVFLLAACGEYSAGESPAERECLRMEEFFARDVYGKVFQEHCLGCHAPQGLAATSRLVFATPATDEDYLAHDLEQILPLARESIDGESLLVLKATGQARHAGGVTIEPGSPEAAYLAELVRRMDHPVRCDDDPPADAFEGLVALEPQALLRKTTLSLVGRLPTDAEQARVAQDGEAALPALVDAMFGEAAFTERLEESWGDLFMTADASTYYEVANDIDDVAYPDAHWYQSLPEPDLSTARAAVSYAVAREGIELVSHLVANDLPMTQLLTADYVMVNPYSARTYGVMDQVQFVDPADREAFLPARLGAIPALGGDHLPHAGVLTTYAWLMRTPSSATNRNRARVRVFEQQFLDTDVQEIAPRADPLQAEGFANPVMEAPQCTVCHATVDPIAGTFQDFEDHGRPRPRNEGWYTDMFAPGFGDQALPEAELHRGLAWLAQATVQDPRFVRAMVAQAYRMVIGHEPLRAPDAQGPDYLARLRVYEAQRAIFHQLGDDFVAHDYNFKVLVKGLLATPYFRTRNLAGSAPSGERASELALIATTRLVTPEQLSRKVQAIFGVIWERNGTDLLRSLSDYRLLYGGMDSREVTSRLEEPSPVMANIQKELANFVGCVSVARDFSRPPAERRFFAAIEPGEQGDSSAVRQTMVGLHATILGETVSADGPEVAADLALWQGLAQDGRAALTDGSESLYMPGLCTTDTYRQDPDYTLRAWMGVITYLASTHTFLYE